VQAFPALLLIFILGCFVAHISDGQQVSPNAVRVTVAINPDGSRIAYEFDLPNHKALATTRGSDGKLRELIRYTLDDAGRFATGNIFGPDERLRFKAIYQYDDAGKLREETQRAKDDTVLHKIVYTYDSLGKQAGYSVYDASGKLINQTIASVSSPTPAKKKAR